MKTYIFEHGRDGGDLGFIRVPLTAEQIAVVQDACLDYVPPAEIVIAGIQALELRAEMDRELRLANSTPERQAEMAAEIAAAQRDVAEVIA